MLRVTPSFYRVPDHPLSVSLNMATTGIKRAATQSTNSNKKPKVNGSIASFFGAPSSKTGQPTVSLSSTSSSSFKKEKWVASLSAEQRELLQLEIETLDESWLAQLKDEVVTPEFLNLKRFLKKEKDAGKTIFPPDKDIYSWSRHTPLHKVKAVILGQDPYHNHNQAHGLAFSVRPPTRAPPSLVNIYTAIKNDYPSFQSPPNKEGLLTPWAERGVLMLNTCLTVRAHEANSHSQKGWERFTQKAIDVVARIRSRGVVFLAWGSPAAKRVAKINKEKHCVLNSVHPSPLSAARGWFNCGHFKKCNEWLAERYGQDEIIDWSFTPITTIVPQAVTAPVEVTVVVKQGDVDAAKLVTSAEDDKENTAFVKLDGADDDFGPDDVDAFEALVAAESTISKAIVSVEPVSVDKVDES